MAFKPTLFYATGTHTMVDFLKKGILNFDPVLNNDPFQSLLDADIWNWRQISFADSFFPLATSGQQGVDALINAINTTAGPFALAGLSQGAWVTSRVYNEIRSGSLTHRRGDLIAGVTMGNPMRELNHTFPGETQSGSFDVPGSVTGGHGCLDSSQRLVGTESLWWDFANNYDPISSVGDTTIGTTWQTFCSLFASAYTGGDLITWALNSLPSLFTHPSDVISLINSVFHDVGSVQGHNYLVPPPPFPNGPMNGETSEQIAANYLNRVGASYVSTAPSTSPTISGPTSPVASNKIVLFTCDGTYSYSPTSPNGSDGDPGAGYPASVATGLDPDMWTWWPINYHPGFSVGGVVNVGSPKSGGVDESFAGSTTNQDRVSLPVHISVDRGVQMIVDAVNSLPAGTKWAMSGLSQGAMVTAKVYKEAKFGSLMPGRFADLVAIAEFGSPCRSHGHTINLPGVIDPAGKGCEDITVHYSYGSESGLVSGAESWYWQFCNANDPVSDVANAAAAEADDLFRIITYGTFASVADLLAQLALAGFNPLGGGWAALNAFLGQLRTLTGDSSPHAQYHLPYTSLANNSKSAVQLAIEYLTGVGQTHWTNSQWTHTSAATALSSAGATSQPVVPVTNNVTWVSTLTSDIGGVTTGIVNGVETIISPHTGTSSGWVNTITHTVTNVIHDVTHTVSTVVHDIVKLDTTIFHDIVKLDTTIFHDVLHAVESIPRDIRNIVSGIEGVVNHLLKLPGQIIKDLAHLIFPILQQIEDAFAAGLHLPSGAVQEVTSKSPLGTTLAWQVPAVPAAGNLTPLYNALLSGDPVAASNAARDAATSIATPDTDIEVIVYDKVYTFKGRCADYKRLTYTHARNQIGTAAMVLKQTDPLLEQIMKCTKEVVPITIKNNYLRWSGRVEYVDYAFKDGEYNVTVYCTDDYQWFDKILCWPNALAPLQVQFPDRSLYLGPAITCIKTLIMEQCFRLQSGLWEAVNNILSGDLSWESWFGTLLESHGNVLQMLMTPIVVVPTDPLFDTSPWTSINGRMDKVSTLVEQVVKDNGLSLTANLWLPGEPQPEGLLIPLKAPTIVVDCKDMSGVTGPTGTFIDGVVKDVVDLQNSALGNVLNPFLNHSNKYAPEGVNIAPLLGVNFVKPWVLFSDHPRGGLREFHLIPHSPLAFTIIGGGKSPQWMNDLINATLEWLIDSIEIAVGFTGIPDTLLNGTFDNLLFAFQQIENFERRVGLGPYGFPEFFQQTGASAYTLDEWFALQSAMWDTRGYHGVILNFDNGYPYTVGKDLFVGSLASFSAMGNLYTDYVERITITDDPNTRTKAEVMIGDGKSHEGGVVKIQRTLTKFEEAMNIILLSNN